MNLIVNYQTNLVEYFIPFQNLSKKMEKSLEDKLKFWRESFVHLLELTS